MLIEGNLAPEFNLDSTMGNVALKDIEGKVLLIFYPRDNTPGCTKQLCAVQDNLSKYQSLNISVLAVNYGSLESHKRFAERYNLHFPILVDKNKEVAKLYEAVNIDGKIIRTVYIVDDNKVVRFARQGLPSTLEIMDALVSIGL